MFKFKNRFFIGILILLIAIFTFFTCSNYGQEIVDLTTVLLKGEKVNLDGDYSEFNTIEEELENYEVYLTGEYHGMHLSYKMEEYMAKYFIENYGTKYIILETAVSEGELLNRYLETGDEKLLKTLMAAHTKTMGYNEDKYNLYKFYYELNNKLSDSKKIRFIGIDIEHEPYVTEFYLKTLIKDLGDPPKVIRDIMEKGKNNSNFSKKEFADELRKSLEDNEDIYSEYFKDNFPYINIVIRNLNAAEGGAQREGLIIQNFKDHYELLPKGKYYGQLGSFHTSKRIEPKEENGEKDISTFANSINSEYEPLKGKVYTMIYWFVNSYYNDGSGKEQEFIFKVPYLKGNGSVRVYTKDDKLILSKFIQNMYSKLSKQKYEENINSWGDVFFLIKDSKASPKYKGY